MDDLEFNDDDGSRIIFIPLHHMIDVVDYDEVIYTLDESEIIQLRDYLNEFIKLNLS